MYLLRETAQFKKDLKRIIRRNPKDTNLIKHILKALKVKGVEGIPVQMKAHKLRGNYKNNWECHIKTDLLIIWIQIEAPNEITLVRLGSHSDLFS